VRRQEVGNHDRSAALRLPRRGSAVCPPVRVSRLRSWESHESGGRPAPPDGSAEYDSRFRAEEKLAVYLAAVARLVRCVHLAAVNHHVPFHAQAQLWGCRTQASRAPTSRYRYSRSSGAAWPLERRLDKHVRCLAGIHPRTHPANSRNRMHPADTRLNPEGDEAILLEA